MLDVSSCQITSNMVRASRTLAKNSLNPYLQYIKDTMHKYEQSAWSQIRHSHKKGEKKNIAANPCCVVYTKIKLWRRQEKGEKEKEIETKRLADLLLAILDRSAVAMATSSPQLVFGAASGITAEDLMFSTHLGSANMVLQSVTPLLAPHHALNPLFRTEQLAPDPPAFKFSPLSARLTDRSPDPDRCFGCSVQWIHGCARSMCCANFDGIRYWFWKNVYL